MKFIIALLFLLLSAQEIPEGIWIHKEHNSKIEIYEQDGVLYGRLLSSHHPNAEKGMSILKDVTASNGEWTGKIFDIEKERWANVGIEPKENVLLLEIKYGFLVKEIRWYSDSQF